MSRDASPLPAPESFPPGLRVAVVAARYNPALADALTASVEQALRSARARSHTVRVPGSMEVPWAAHRLAASGHWDAIVALGVVIAGDTRHHEHIALITGPALQDTARLTGVPIINGILVVESPAQAEARVRGELRRGPEFAAAALAMAQWKNQDLSPPHD